jgi:glycosyltransferase involved in cell wall biosynthesis
MAHTPAPPAPIAVVLPHAERFVADQAGAIALQVQAATLASRFKSRIRVYGSPVGEPLPGIAFVPVVPVAAWWRSKTWAYAAALTRLLRQDRPLLVEVHNRPAMLLHLARREPALKLSLHLHNDPLAMAQSRTARQRRRLLALAAHVYCVSAFIRGRFLNGLDGRLDERLLARLHVLHNGIAWPRAPSAAKERLILFVGRLNPDKGAHLFVDALAQILPRHPDWQAVLVGGQLPSGREAGSAYAKAVLERCGALGPRVQSYGFMPHGEVMTLFQRAAIAVVPSLWDEPFSRTVIEGLSSGCAVIASARGGIPEPMGDAGILLAQPSAMTLAAALEELISAPERLAQLQARASARQGFEIERVTARQDALRLMLAPELGQDDRG